MDDGVDDGEGLPAPRPGRLQPQAPGKQTRDRLRYNLPHNVEHQVTNTPGEKYCHCQCQCYFYYLCSLCMAILSS